MASKSPDPAPSSKSSRAGEAKEQGARRTGWPAGAKPSNDSVSREERLRRSAADAV
jgi:hypothetical protein